MARKILLADDSVTAQNMGRRILTDAGYDVTTVNNGSAALKKIAELKPDLIVLDVYMPGYGGLEVCQRLKENRDTARIPVLLTVGKLEPFKADEARRVRADSFIIKPFEASELLTVLTKLEDKIVPQAEAYKPGRFAKAIAAVDQITEKGEGFGDTETGWKDRLKFPSAKPASETEPETPSSPSTKFRDLDRGEDFKPAEAPKVFERPMPAGLPPDITAEEIAAITAAAATFSGNAATPATVAEPVPAEAKTAEVPEAEIKTEAATAEAVPNEAPAQEAPPATFASATETTESASTPAIAEAVESPAPAVAEVGETQAASVENAEAKESAALPPTEEKPEAKAEEEIVTPAADKPADADVLAALASLVPSLPTNGHEDGNAWQGGSASESKFTVASAIAQLAGVGTVASGPRWIAEEVAVESGEAALILEREMEKALSAMAAIAADSSAAGVQDHPATFIADNISVETPVTAVSVAEPELSASVPAEASAVTEVSSTPEPSTEAPVAAAVEATTDATANKEPEPVPAAPEAAISTTSTPAPDAVSSVTVEAIAVAEPKAESALAAAAGAGQSSTEPAPAPEATSQASAPAVTAEPSTAATIDDRPEAELNAATAAAWEHWQQIRESVVGSGEPAQVADAPPVEVKEAQPQPTSSSAVTTEAEAADTATTNSTDPDAIASIVDTMLAELKPKLVEEIAKKMAKEKKKKK